MANINKKKGKHVLSWSIRAVIFKRGRMECLRPGTAAEDKILHNFGLDS